MCCAAGSLHPAQGGKPSNGTLKGAGEIKKMFTTCSLHVRRDSGLAGVQRQPVPYPPGMDAVGGSGGPPATAQEAWLPGTPVCVQLGVFGGVFDPSRSPDCLRADSAAEKTPALPPPSTSARHAFPTGVFNIKGRRFNLPQV